ncbi:MAG: hypothetical protein J6L66_02775, partial [Anaerotignum sp.]|nr:hypothetical protein [Anaerotignum sp.]
AFLSSSVVKAFAPQTAALLLPRSLRGAQGSGRRQSPGNPEVADAHFKQRKKEYLSIFLEIAETCQYFATQSRLRLPPLLGRYAI